MSQRRFGVTGLVGLGTSYLVDFLHFRQNRTDRAFQFQLFQLVFEG